VLDDKVSVQAARNGYGVVVDLGRRCIDEAATADLRARLRAGAAVMSEGR
jgi:hypothetical protein